MTMARHGWHVRLVLGLLTGLADAAGLDVLQPEPGVPGLEVLLHKPAGAHLVDAARRGVGDVAPAALFTRAHAPAAKVAVGPALQASVLREWPGTGSPRQSVEPNRVRTNTARNSHACNSSSNSNSNSNSSSSSSDAMLAQSSSDQWWGLWWRRKK